jgi:hypothetical protein
VSFIPVFKMGMSFATLAPTTLATRGELVESIERQLSRPSALDLNAANVYVNVARFRAVEAGTRNVCRFSGATKARITNSNQVSSLAHLDPVFIQLPTLSYALRYPQTEATIVFSWFQRV